MNAKIIRIDSCENCPYVIEIHQGQVLVCTNYEIGKSTIGLTKENPSIPDWCPLDDENSVFRNFTIA